MLVAHFGPVLHVSEHGVFSKEKLADTVSPFFTVTAWLAVLYPLAEAVTV